MADQREAYDTETTCHCGGKYRGSDHCPECFCEQYESVNCSTWCGEWRKDKSKKSG